MTPHATPDTPALALPPAFEAFYALHYAPYLDYAQAHLSLAEATTCINTVFGTLISRWDTLVGSYNPTAEAWDHMSRQVRQSTPLLAMPGDRTLHYDVQVLATLGYTAATIAAITGRDPSKIRYLSRTPATPPRPCPLLHAEGAHGWASCAEPRPAAPFRQGLPACSPDP